jgi:hypothetical protein
LKFRRHGPAMGFQVGKVQILEPVANPQYEHVSSENSGRHGSHDTVILQKRQGLKGATPSVDVQRDAVNLRQYGDSVAL